MTMNQTGNSPPRFDIVLWTGNNAPRVIWRLPFDLTGSILVFTLFAARGEFVRRSDTGGLLLDLSSAPASGDVIWAYNASETRRFPRGLVGPYELERRIPGGEERTYVYGNITTIGGNNDD